MRFVERFRQKYLPGLLARVKARPVSHYVSMMAAGKPFSFSRFGDGEWNARLGRPGENCDGHEFFPELGADLREALVSRPAYWCGMQYRAIRDMGTAIRAFLDANAVALDWHDADVFHYANNDATLFPLVKQLRAMKVVVVGPAHDGLGRHHHCALLADSGPAPRQVSLESGRAAGVFRSRRRAAPCGSPRRHLDSRSFRGRSAGGCGAGQEA